MGENQKLVAKERIVLGKEVKAIRRNGETPVVIYGGDRTPLALSVDSHDFELLNRKAGGNTIIAVEIIRKDGTKEKKNVLIHQVDIHPVTSRILHADLIQIKMNEKITTGIPLKFVGDSLAVIDLSGSLLTPLNEVEVECLPADLPHEIEVDLAPLVDFDTVIHVSDIKIGTGVVVLTDPEAVVAHVEAPRSDEELEELEEAVAETEAPESEHGEAEAATDEAETTTDSDKKE
jgi:large subunit ribosomal protein L25